MRTDCIYLKTLRDGLTAQHTSMISYPMFSPSRSQSVHMISWEADRASLSNVRCNKAVILLSSGNGGRRRYQGLIPNHIHLLEKTLNNMPVSGVPLMEDISHQTNTILTRYYRIYWTIRQLFI